jgi:hypothetical protein
VRHLAGFGENQSTSSVAFRIEYDAPSQTYTLQDANNISTEGTEYWHERIAFGPATLVPSETTDELAVYRRTLPPSGPSRPDTTATLKLTRPGTAGDWRYSYVGGLLLDFRPSHPYEVRRYSSVYGVPTPAAVRPAGVSYSLVNVRHESVNGQLTECSGTARLTVDPTGTRFTLVMPNGCSFAVFRSAITIEGAIDPDGNLFCGFSCFDWGDFSTLEGRFFGPGGEEVGLVFRASDTHSARGGSGLAIGRRE